MSKRTRDTEEMTVPSLDTSEPHLSSHASKKVRRGEYQVTFRAYTKRKKLDASVHQLLGMKSSNTLHDLVDMFSKHVFPSRRCAEDGGDGVDEHLWYFQRESWKRGKERKRRWIAENIGTFDDRM